MGRAVGRAVGQGGGGQGPTLVLMSRLLAFSLLTWDSAMSARSSASSSSCCTFRNLVRLLRLQVPHARLQLLQLLLPPLESQLLSLVQAHLQVLDGLLHVLLHPLQVGAGVLLLLQLLCHHGLVAAPGLSVQGGLEGVHHPQVVALGLLHLLVLLSQLAFMVHLDLVELQLGPQDLPFFMLQRGLEEEGRGRP
uniref:Tektin n=1 Tax=Strigops habroptila TaxID=2489341 RepID=A0A672UKV8_STRHB